MWQLSPLPLSDDSYFFILFFRSKTYGCFVCPKQSLFVPLQRHLASGGPTLALHGLVHLGSPRHPPDFALAINFSLLHLATSSRTHIEATTCTTVPRLCTGKGLGGNPRT